MKLCCRCHTNIKARLKAQEEKKNPNSNISLRKKATHNCSAQRTNTRTLRRKNQHAWFLFLWSVSKYVHYAFLVECSYLIFGQRSRIHASYCLCMQKSIKIKAKASRLLKTKQKVVLFLNTFIRIVLILPLS